jgi:hypothetical protein
MVLRAIASKLIGKIPLLAFIFACENKREQWTVCAERLPASVEFLT